MLALIDADIVLHRVGFTTDGKVNKDGTIKEQDPEWIAKARCNEMLEGILHDTGATEYQLWLSDARENNFRTHLWHGYKANRTAPRPVHYDYIKELLISEWGARIAYGMEADDALGIGQEKVEWSHAFSGEWEGHTVICSIDKDLKQVPGLHYNFVKKEWDAVDDRKGMLSFYASILIGDTVDNITGCRGIGPKKANKALATCYTDDCLIDTIISTYQACEQELSTEEILSHILLAGRLLKIKQTEEETLWGSQHSRLMQAT